jgi:hypothetical protein
MTLRWSAVAAILVMVLAGTTRVATHVLDQYVQLSRIDVRRDGLTIDLELTAGIEIAQPLFFQINSDRDGQISDREARAYARQVIDDLFVSVDDRPLALTLAQYTYPRFEEMRSGTGTIRLRLSSIADLHRPGAHQIVYRNRHRLDRGVYAANALMPSSSDVRIAAQHRDQLQREIRVDVVIGER